MRPTKASLPLLRIPASGLAGVSRHSGAPPASRAQSAPLKPLGTRSQSKQERVIAMLREGTTIAAIMIATGWQAHSVRGFFASVVRKRLKLPLISSKSGLERIYRIAKRQTSAKRTSTKRRKQ